MKTILFLGISLLFFITQVYGRTNPMSVFENSIGGAWVSEGVQQGGLQGKTVDEFTWGLDGKIVKTKHYSNDPKTLEFGLRNEGIRVSNAADSIIQFYEFDKLGGITSGTILIEGKNMHYEYVYHGLNLRDTWKFVDSDTYELTVGVLKDDVWETKYHEAIFTRKSKTNLYPRLTGISTW